MNQLDQIVFVVQDGKILESPMRDLHGFNDLTTTPKGIGPRLHIRPGIRYTVRGEIFGCKHDAEALAIDIRNETGTMPEIEQTPTSEVWTWGVGGNCPRRLEVHLSETDATNAVENYWAAKFWECFDAPAFATRQEAEEFLNDEQT